MSNINFSNCVKEIVLPLFTCFCIIASSVISPFVMQAVEIDAEEAVEPLSVQVIRADTEKLHDVFFDKGSADIRVDAEPVLLDNAEMLRQNPKTYVVIEGYCSEQESAIEGLSQLRADQVKEYMVSEGVNPERIITVGKCSQYLMGQSPEERSTHPELDQRVHFSSLDEYAENDFFFG